MEVFGKVSDIVLSREGTSQATGNKYEIHTVVVQGSDNVCFDVFGTREHLEKHGIVKGAEGKFTIKTEVNFYNNRYYQRCSLEDIRNGFKPLGNQVTAQPKSAEPAEQKQEDAPFPPPPPFATDALS